MRFTYVPIQWRCECGYRPESVNNGLGSDGTLVADFYCPTCGIAIMAKIRIKKLLSCLPPKPELIAPLKPPLALPPLTGQFDPTEQDLKFLAEFHIGESEDGA